MDHKVELIPFMNRVTPYCSCNGIKHREFFGERRTANAKREIFKHLEAVYEDESFHEAEYQLKLSGDLNCPICKDSLEISKKDGVLLSENTPSVINCENGHEFDAYLKNGTLFLFLDSDSGPFNTTN